VRFELPTTLFDWGNPLNRYAAAHLKQTGRVDKGNASFHMTNHSMLITASHEILYFCKLYGGAA